MFDRAASRPHTPVRDRLNFEYLKSCARLTTIVRLLRSDKTRQQQQHNKQQQEQQEEEEETNSPLPPSTTNLILREWERVTHLTSEIKPLLHTPSIVRSLASSSPSSPFETVFHFTDIRLCETLCHVWKHSILVAALLQHHQLSPSHPESEHIAAQSALNILKSYEGVRRLAPVGTFFMHLDLPRAALALPDPYRSWALGAYAEILDAGSRVGFDVAGPTRMLAGWLREWEEGQGNLWSAWWLGGGGWE